MKLRRLLYSRYLALVLAANAACRSETEKVILSIVYQNCVRLADVSNDAVYDQMLTCTLSPMNGLGSLRARSRNSVTGALRKLRTCIEVDFLRDQSYKGQSDTLSATERLAKSIATIA